MILRIVFNHFRLHPFSNFLTLLAIAFCLGLLGGFWSLSENLRILHAAKASQEGEVSVFVDAELSAEKLSEMEQRFRKQEWVEALTRVSSEEALRRLKDSYGETVVSSLGEKSLPVTWRLKMKDKVSEMDLQRSLDSIKTWDGVIDLDLGGDLWSGELDQGNTKALTSWANLLLGVVFIVVILLISHITRISFESTKDDVETLTLLGASKRWIFAPLLVESFLVGLFGSILGLGVTILFMRYGLPPLSLVLFDKMTPIQELSWNALWKILSLGVLASLVGAILTWPLVLASGRKSLSA